VGWQVHCAKKNEKKNKMKKVLIFGDGNAGVNERTMGLGYLLSASHYFGFREQERRGRGGGP